MESSLIIKIQGYYYYRKVKSYFLKYQMFLTKDTVQEVLVILMTLLKESLMNISLY